MVFIVDHIFWQRFCIRQIDVCKLLGGIEIGFIPFAQKLSAKWIVGLLPSLPRPMWNTQTTFASMKNIVGFPWTTQVNYFFTLCWKITQQGRSTPLCSFKRRNLHNFFQNQSVTGCHKKSKSSGYIILFRLHKELHEQLLFADLLWSSGCAITHQLLSVVIHYYIDSTYCCSQVNK